MLNHSDHYDADYFNWQRTIGIFGGEANSFKFQKSIKKTDIVIDFGCGGGFLLNNLNCYKKIGIEPNINARDQLKINKVEAYGSPQELLKEKGSNFADVIIRHPTTFEKLGPGEEGLIQVVSMLPISYPGMSLLTEDIGFIENVDNDKNGLMGKALRVLGRVEKAELRGCSDVIGAGA